MTNAPGGWAETRSRIEGGFERWGHTVARRPWRVIVLSLLAVAVLASPIPRLEVDTSSEGFLEPDDPVRMAYDAFRAQFGREDAAILAIRTSDVFRIEFLERLRSLHEELENELPHLDEVTSLVNVRYTHGEGDQLWVDDFLEDWPEDAQDLEILRERALTHPLYRGVLISEDATLATVMVRVSPFSTLESSADALAGFDDETIPSANAPTPRRILTGAENSELVSALQEIVARHSGPDFEIHVAGQPVLTDTVMRGMFDDMGRFTILSLVIIAGFLAFLFRSATAVMLALTIALLSIVCGFGVMAAVGIPMTPVSQVLPSFLLAVGVGNSVHLLAIFLQQRQRGSGVEEALAYALGHSGLAIVMTGLTTAGSLLSFLSATLALIADFGISAPVGVMLSLVLSLVLLPALIAVTPMRVRPARNSALRRLPVACGALGVRHPLTVTLTWTALFAVSLVFALQVRISNYALDWFDPDVPFRVATELIDRELGGASSIEIVIDSGRENGLYEPELLRRIDALQHHVEGHPFGTGHVKRATVSIVEVVKEIHQALNGNEPGSYVIPDDRRLISQELLLFENSGTDDLEDIVDSQFRIGRVSLPIPFTDSILSVPILEEFERDLPKILGDQASLYITGQFSIGAKTVSATVNSMVRTYAVAFTVITPFMMLLLGSVRTGLLSMAPATGAILISLGVMGVFDMPLDGFTLLVGSIALGLAVDDTIHFMHNYARARARGQDVESAVRTTLESTGQALLYTSLVLIAGFLAYTQATLNLLINFGILTALAIGIAFAANVTLAPALVTLVARLRQDDESPQPVVPKSLPGRSPPCG